MFNVSALGSDKAGVQHWEYVGGPFHEIRLVYLPRAFVGEKKTNPRLCSTPEIIFLTIYLLPRI
jgi:hypothetical protein